MLHPLTMPIHSHLLTPNPSQPLTILTRRVFNGYMCSNTVSVKITDRNATKLGSALGAVNDLAAGQEGSMVTVSARCVCCAALCCGGLCAGRCERPGSCFSTQCQTVNLACWSPSLQVKGMSTELSLELREEKTSNTTLLPPYHRLLSSFVYCRSTA